MGPLLAVLAACVDPVAYGAKPNDGASDAAAIQKALDVAIDQHQDLCLGAGVFDLDRPTPPASLEVRGAVTIRGTGDDTVLEMNGDGGRTDWYAIWIHGAKNVVIQDLAIEALETTNTKEQTHLIQIGEGSEHIRVERVRLGPMRRPDQTAGTGAHGDCIKLVGEKDNPVRDLTVTDSDLIYCDRSGITFQRGVQGATIEHVAFWDASDAAIDFEPTAPGRIEDVTLHDLAIARSSATQGSWAISITGFKDDLARNIKISESDIQGGGISVIDAEKVVIDRNHIVSGMGTYATVFTERQIRDLTVSNNTIERVSGAPPGPVVQTIHANGKVASGVKIIDNELVQGTDKPVVSVVSASDVQVTGNTLSYGGRAGDAPGVEVSSVIKQVDDVKIDGNLVRGPVGAAVRLYAHGAPMGRVDVTNNQGGGAQKSIECVGAAARSFRSPVRVKGNHFGTAASTCDAAPP